MSDPVRFRYLKDRGDPRLAGDLERYHAWPTQNRQDIAQHSWHVARILLAIYPNCGREGIIEALFHDIGEIASGDVPFGAKDKYPALREPLKKAEHEARLAMVVPWAVPPRRPQSTFVTKILKLADLIEMWEWGAKDLVMGNRLCIPVVEATLREIRNLVADDEIQRDPDVPAAVETYIGRRTAEWRLNEI